MTKDDVKRMLRVCIDPECDRGDCYEQCKYFYNVCCIDYLCRDALAIIEEQEKEIERLRTTLGQCNTELNSALESLKSQCHEIGELKAKVKQAQIDVLNKVKNCRDATDSDCYPYLERIVNKLIEEVQNAEDKG